MSDRSNKIMEYSKLIKVVVVGDSEVGKSSLIRRYVEDEFIDSDSYNGTIGVDFSVKVVGSTKLQIWDTAGQERFRTITTAYYRGAHQIIIAYSAADRESFRHASNWLEEAKEHASDQAVIVLVATKTDLPRQVSTEDCKNFAMHHEVPFVETSALQNVNVAKPFEILLTHEKHSLLFEQLLESGMSAPWMRSKLMVVGQGRAGKTATVRSLLREEFDPEWKSTVGAELTQTNMTAGRGEFKKMDGDDEYATMMAARAVMTKEAERREESNRSLRLENMPTQGPGKQLKRELRQKLQAVSASTQQDTLQRPLMDKEDVARRVNLNLFLHAEEHVDDLALTVWDYGGQKVFYTLHHLFLTRYGVYLLVFDMRDLGGEDRDTSYLEFWLSSIALHAPRAPVILVGTFADVVRKEQDYQAINAVLAGVVSKKSLEQVKREPESGLLFRPVSNLSRMGINSLQRELDVVIRKQEYVHREVPLRWMRTLDLMLNRKESYLKMKEVSKIYSSFQRKSPSQGEVESMLYLFNELGVIVYITSTTRLREIVTTRPQWLLDSLSKVIRDEIHRFDRSEVEQAQMLGDISTLFDSGIASRDLLEFVWERDQVEFLIEFMQNCLLLSPWPYSPEGEAYLVPSLLRSSASKMKGYRLSFTIRFEDDIPHGVFQRIVCICVSESRSRSTNARKPVLARFGAKFSFESSEAAAVQVDESREIICSIVSAADASLFVVFVQMILNEINNTLFHGNLGFEFYFSHKGQEVNLATAKLKNVDPWFIMSKEETRKVYNIEDFLA